MLPLSLLGRGFYRRKEEGKIDPRFRRAPHHAVLIDSKDMMTSTLNLNNNADVMVNEPEVVKKEIFPDNQFKYTNNNDHVHIPFIDDHHERHVQMRDAAV